jgi:L-lactate utilization protein LutB
MVNETDLSGEKQWLYEQRARVAVANLVKRNINGIYAPGRREALRAALDMIPAGAKVVRGDSITVDQIGVVDELKKRGQNEIIDPLERDAEGAFLMPEEGRKRAAREAFFADVFLTGSNAVTLDGKLVNTDGRGNRVAPMIYGPDKVIFLAGANKIVKDLDEALQRIHGVAAPVNAKRHALKHHAPELAELPCVRTGSCADCRHEFRICRYTVIIEGAMPWEKDRLNVILVGEELGI